MTLPQAQPAATAAEVLGLHDPILQELWATKAKINADAHYSIEEIAQRVQARQPEIKRLAESAKAH